MAALHLDSEAVARGRMVRDELGTLHRLVLVPRQLEAAADERRGDCGLVACALELVAEAKALAQALRQLPELLLDPVQILRNRQDGLRGTCRGCGVRLI